MLRRWLALLGVAATVTAGVWTIQNLRDGSLQLQVGGRVADSQANVKPRDLDLVCPGGFYQSGGASGTKVGAFKQQGDAEVRATTSSVLGTTLRSAQLDRTNFVDLDGTGKRQLLESSTTDPRIFSLIDPNGAADQGSSLLTAVQIQSAETERARGIAATDCQRPSSEIWLIGGDTSVGREGLLILQNPSRVETVVNYEAFTKTGLQTPVGPSSVVIAAGETTVIPLTALATEAKLIAVHIRAEGGNIAAWLQQKTIRGLAAGGLELIAPNAGPTTSAVIPAIEIQGSAAAKKLMQQNIDYEDTSAALAIFVPGEKPANIGLQVLGANQKTYGTVVQQTAEAGATTLIQLSDLADGSFTAYLNSDAPIVAGVRYSHSDLKATPQTDFAWAQPAAEFKSRVLALPKSAGSRVFLSNQGSADASVQVTNLLTGAGLSVKVVAGAFTVVTGKAGAVWQIDSDEPIAAGVVASTSKGVANIAVQDYKNLGGKVRVRLR